MSALSEREWGQCLAGILRAARKFVEASPEAKRGALLHNIDSLLAGYDEAHLPCPWHLVQCERGCEAGECLARADFFKHQNARASMGYPVCPSGVTRHE